MDRKNSYGRKPLEELIREYAHAVDNGDWQDSRLSKKMIVNEVYARIKNTFDMLDAVPEDADQIYEMLIAPMGMERGREDGQLKEEIQEEPDPLRGIQEILLAARELDSPLSLDCTLSDHRITVSRMTQEHEEISCGEQRAVTRFQAFQAFTDAEHFAYSIWSIVHTMKTREEFIELLNSEFTEEELQLIVTAARERRFPVSLERLQSRVKECGIPVKVFVDDGKSGVSVRIPISVGDESPFLAYESLDQKRIFDNAVKRSLAEYRKKRRQMENQ